jgi:glycine rich protein/VCBS repeat protein
MNLILTIISLIISLFIKPVYAVDYSVLALAETNNSIYVQSGTPIDSISPSDIISNSPVSQDSNQNRQASSLKNELEPVYKINEEVTVELFNTDVNSIETVLTNDKDEKIETEVDQIDKQGITTLVINPPSQLKPGKYTLEIIDQTGSTIKQDFLWGVLAINPNKSIYNPGENANLAMAVLDEIGNMVCDAKLILKVINPDGDISELSTENNKIIVNQIECQSSNFTLKPDYEANFLTSKTGKYLLELTAETQNGSYTITDNFEVKTDIDFDIERISATRIYPLNTYPMTINIKANKDFNGNIYDEVPTSFKLIFLEEESIYIVDQTNQNTQKIKWSINLKKGESISLKYQYKAPSISPQFYLIGPLQLTTTTDLLYEESRQWQIAADATTETFTDVGTTNWVAPDNVYSVEVQVWGAGGGGGDGPNKDAGGGGGGGAYVAGTMPVTPGNSYNITVGAGGDAGASTSAGQDGGNSTFNSTTFIAQGGKGGASIDIGGSGGLTSASTGTTKFDGGKGGNGNTTGESGGGGGGAAGPDGAGIAGGNASTSIGGVGGTGDNGSGGAGGTAGNKSDGGIGGTSPLGGGGGGGGDNGKGGGPGGNVGGGGGGAEANSTTEGKGGDGQIILTYTAINQAPATPTLVSPTDTDTGISQTPTFQTVTTDPAPYTDDLQYEVKVCTDSDMSVACQTFTAANTGWSGADVGTTSYSSGTTATYVIQIGDSLASSTTYYWKTRAIDPDGSDTWSSTQGSPFSFTTINYSPTAPNLVSPANSATGVTTSPTLTTVTTDPETDPMQYKIVLATNATFTGTTQTFDQTVSNVGWSAQDVGTSAYASGTTATYVIQSTLDYSTMYYWKSQAIDYSGSDTWSSLSIGYSFTTDAAPPLPPNTPSLIQPANSAIGQSITPTFKTVTTDSNNDDLQYEVKVCTDSDMSVACQTFTAANTGWSGADVGTTSYSSGTTATYIVQIGDSLAYGNTYYWKTRAIDPDGSDTWSSTQGSPFSFTTIGPPNPVQSSFRWRNDDDSEGGAGVGDTSITFATGVTYPTISTSPNSVTSSDFNNDGYSDLATADSGGDSITVFINNGDGTYSTGTSYPTFGDYPYRITSADFNNDGYSDLATANYFGNNITVFTNNGDGTYGTGVTYPTISNIPTSITAVDTGNNGKVDLAVTSEAGNSVIIFTNNGIGDSTSFDTGVEYSVGASTPFSVISADFNNDGYSDLATANYASPYTISILTNNGNGTYATGITYPTIGNTPRSVTSADFNNDGKIDLATANYGTNNITVFTNAGDGTYGTGVTYPTIGTSPYSITSADFDNDGNPDLVTANYITNNITVFTNTGDGTYGTGITYPIIGTSPNAVISSDFDNDGNPDLVTANNGSPNSITVFINTTTDAFTFGTFGTGVTYPTITTGPIDVTSADFNNDGKTDLATANYNGHGITIFQNYYGIGSSTFSIGTTSSISSQPRSITSADFDNDGKTDLATANYNEGNITIFQNYYGIGSSTFSAGTTFPTIDINPWPITSADFDNDGKTDLAIVDATTNNITIFQNYYGIGSSTFSAGTTFPTATTGLYSITPADFNNDGKTDLVTTSNTSNSITVFLNYYGIGSSTFSAGTTYPTLASGPVSVASADFNNDGKADLATANNGTPDSITVFLNYYGIGSSTFSAGTTYPTAENSGPYYITSADFNNDGNFDLATANYDGDNTTIFLNYYGIGSSTFSVGTTYPTGNATRAITSADFNNDGKTDLATAVQAENNLMVLINTGTEILEGATWLAEENIGITDVDIDTNIRLRFSIGNTGDIDSFNFRLQVAPKGASAGCTGVDTGNFVDVGTTVGSNVAVMTTSPNFDNQDVTTNQLTDSATTFVAGKIVEHSSNQTDSISLSTDTFTEVEYNFQMTSNAGSTTPYCFRVVNVDTDLAAYTQVAELVTTTIAPSNQAPSAPYLPYVDNTDTTSGQQTPVYGLIDHTPAFSAVFDDPNTSDTTSNYQLEINTDSGFGVGTSIWDTGKSSIGSTCNEDSRCADVIYGGGTSLTDGSTYYWRIKFWDNSDVGSSWSTTQEFTMNNSPEVSNTIINGNSSIDLSEGLSIGISWVSTVTDVDGYTNLSSATGKLYRLGVGASCTLDDNNCYSDASCDLLDCSGNSCSALCIADIYFFAEPTDIGSTFVDQYYQAWVEATDIRTEVGSTLSSSTSININTISGFSIGTSLVYGELFAGSDTGSSNTVTIVTNTGNSVIDIEIEGDYMCTDYPSCGGLSLEPESQEYNLDTFTYGSGVTLSTSPTVVEIGISKPTENPSNSSKNLYWGIGIPSLKEPGSYQGATIILVS